MRRNDFSCARCESCRARNDVVKQHNASANYSGVDPKRDPVSTGHDKSFRFLLDGNRVESCRIIDASSLTFPII